MVWSSSVILSTEMAVSVSLVQYLGHCVWLLVYGLSPVQFPVWSFLQLVGFHGLLLC